MTLLSDHGAHWRLRRERIAHLIRVATHEDHVIRNAADLSSSSHVVDVEFLIRAHLLARVRNEMDMDARCASSSSHKVCEAALGLVVVVSNVETHQRIDHRVLDPLLCELSDHGEQEPMLGDADHTPEPEALRVGVNKPLHLVSGRGLPARSDSCELHEHICRVLLERGKEHGTPTREAMADELPQ